jgi:hypothetical protein
MGTHTEGKPNDVALLTKVSGELDAAAKAIAEADLVLAETLLENAVEHLAAAGADPTARASYRPPPPRTDQAGSSQESMPTSGPAHLIGADEMTRFEFLQLMLGFRTHRVPAAVALTRLVRLLQQRKDLPGGREFYAELSKAAYAERASSLAHSHPPPPVEPKDDE